MGSLQSLTVCLISAVIAGFCGGRVASSSDARGVAPALDELRTRRLVLVDDQGEERGIFEVGQGSASSRVTFWMGGPDGEAPSATLWIDQLEGVPEARLLLLSEGGVSPSTGRLSLRSAAGLPTASLTFGEGEARGSILLGPQTRDSTDALVFDSGASRTAWPRR